MRETNETFAFYLKQQQTLCETSGQVRTEFSKDSLAAGVQVNSAKWEEAWEDLWGGWMDTDVDKKQHLNTIVYEELKYNIISTVSLNIRILIEIVSQKC